jgi:hypothetical protein
MVKKREKSGIKKEKIGKKKEEDDGVIKVCYTEALPAANEHI